MKTRTALSKTQDWTLFSLRILFLIGLALLLLLGSNALEISISGGALLILLGVPIVVNLLWIPFILVDGLRPYTALAGIAGDAALVFVAAPYIANTPVLFLAVTGSALLLMMVRFGWVWTIVDAVAVVVALGLGLGSQAATVLPTLGPEIFLVVLLTIMVGVLAQSARQNIAERARQMDADALIRQEKLADIRERTRAISDMAQVLTSTLNYHRVLDAALSIGRLSLRDPNISSFMAIVFLFRPEDRKLHPTTWVGIARADEVRSTAGTSGIIGQSLTECIPIFGAEPEKDPELQYYLTFRRAKSLLVVPLRAGYDNYGVLLFASKEPNAFDEEYKTLLEAVGTQATIALQNAVLYQDLADEKERLVEADEEARKKLARDLHDGPTQTISAIAMRMAIIQRMLEKTPDKVPEELQKVESLARQTTSEIRHLLFTLRPLSLETQGIASALQQLADKMDATYDQRVVISVGPDIEETLTHHQSGTLFYIIEEAVNNARKHAQAKQIRVRISHHGDVILAEIADNGVGFDTSLIQDNYEARGSLGMVNLRERTEMLEGQLSIESTPGKGTTISVVIPTDNNTVYEPRQRVREERENRFSLSPMR